MTTKKNLTINIKKWNDTDMQNFKDRNILRAITVPDKKKVKNKRICRINIPINHNFD